MVPSLEKNKAKLGVPAVLPCLSPDECWDMLQTPLPWTGQTGIKNGLMLDLVKDKTLGYIEYEWFTTLTKYVWKWEKKVFLRLLWCCCFQPIILVVVKHSIRWILQNKGLKYLQNWFLAQWLLHCLWPRQQWHCSSLQPSGPPSGYVSHSSWPIEQKTKSNCKKLMYYTQLTNLET